MPKICGRRLGGLTTSQKKVGQMSAASLTTINWRNPIEVENWKRDFQARFKKPLVGALGLDVNQWTKRVVERIFRTETPIDLIGPDYENVLDRAHSLEGHAKKPRGPQRKGKKFLVPAMLERIEGEWVYHPMLKRQDAQTLEKARQLHTGGLVAKAERQAACGIVGGKVICENGHEFFEAYDCELRYCRRCGPKLANQLFAKHCDRLLFVAQSLMLCGTENCAECERAIKEKQLPHWPPPKGARPSIVCAKLDFTVRSEGTEMPAPERMRMLNRCIKKFCRAIEKEFHIRRDQYGLAYCDELGGNNNNPHAHGIYVGPWLPNTKKELAMLWEKVTEKEFPGTFIISIKYARNFSEALYHAVKYPAKFAQRSSPQRLAELETIFHRVRRFHTLARFYNPDVPEQEPEPRACPVCKRNGKFAALSDWVTLEGVLELQHQGLRELGEATRQAGFERANASP